MRHFNLWIIIKIHKTAKQISSVVFNAVKDEKLKKKLFDLVKIETDKIEKRSYEDRPFKEGDKWVFHQE